MVSRFALLLLVACGSAPDEGPPSPPENPAPEQASDEADVETEVETETPPARAVRCTPGFESVFTPTAEQLGENREALASHVEGDHEAAIARFGALVAGAPGYGSARFNLACAQTKAGQEEAALETLSDLLCADLPTNLPRALADEDLTPLHDRIAALGQTLVAQYREASAGGETLVAFGVTENRRDRSRALYWAQPGFWKNARFIPAAPRQQARGDDTGAPMFPSMVASDRVVQLETTSSYAEADFLPPFRVTERSLFDGVERHSRRFDESQNDFFGARIGIHDGRTYVRLSSLGARPTEQTRALQSGAVITNPPLGATIEVGMLAWTPVFDAPSNVELRGSRTLQHGSESIELDAAHRRMFKKRVLVHEGVALVHSASVGDCGLPDRYIIEAVDLESGTSLWKDEGEGQRLLHIMGGRLWIQTEEGLFVFDDLRQSDRTALPAGLGLSSQFRVFNSMC